MRLRSFLAVLLLAVLVPAGAQDLGRADRLRQDYLTELVRRGLAPVITAENGQVPYWPQLDRDWADAESLEPGADTELVGAWVDLREGRPTAALGTLKSGWPHPGVSRFSPRSWGTSLFDAWEPGADTHEWTQAWLGWQEKVYSPAALVRGLEVLEKADPSAVVPLLKQSLQLYPDDRRFLPLVARHPGVVLDAAGILARDLALHGGFGPVALAAWLNRDPSSRDLLVKAGYPVARLDAARTRDYGAWLASKSTVPPGDGEWTWDTDGDGRTESRLVFLGGQLAGWTRTEDGSLWSLAFTGGQPSRVTETRGGATWTLDFENYPWVRSLDYQWAGQRIVYRFAPLSQAVPLWPAERLQAAGPRLPAALADLWAPLDPRVLAQASSAVETWNDGLLVRTVYLAGGEVWLAVEDTDRDGRADTWSYFRSGELASVYRDPEGRGQAGLRELYQKGQLVQVQAKSGNGSGAEFVLFPQEGVQLWDPHGDRRPLERLFVWTGTDQLQALVFSGKALPWDTMPPWEPRP